MHLLYSIMGQGAKKHIFPIVCLNGMQMVGVTENCFTIF